MALGAKVLSRLKTKYEAGEKIRDIAKDMGIHQSTITKNAKKNGWEHGSNKEEIASRVEKRVTAQLIERDVSRATDETEKFLKDAEIIRNYTLQVIGKILSNRNSEGQIDMSDRDTADTLFTYLKIGKISMETITLGYTGKRKALRMDENVLEEMQVLPWED